jgi:hypothetical protein
MDFGVLTIASSMLGVWVGFVCPFPFSSKPGFAVQVAECDAFVKTGKRYEIETTSELRELILRSEGFGRTFRAGACYSHFQHSLLFTFSP